MVLVSQTLAKTVVLSLPHRQMARGEPGLTPRTGCEKALDLLLEGLRSLLDGNEAHSMTSHSPGWDYILQLHHSQEAAGSPLSSKAYLQLRGTYKSEVAYLLFCEIPTSLY